MSLLHELRQGLPGRPLTITEAYGLAERQALLLLKLSNITEAPVPSQVISGLPFVTVAVRVPMGSSGATRWIKPHWVVLLNGLEPQARQRFSLAHEFKHILDHKTATDRPRPVPTNPVARRRVEQLCDFFAGCLLMPRPWVKAAYFSGIQDIGELAQHFEVSQQAMQVRLLQLGLVDPYARCSGMDNTYLRSPSVSSLKLAA
jgi:Zn-dependent peptidase ImmA (M78 family)